MNDIPPNEAKISAQAVAAFGNTPTPRLRQVLQGLVRHLHAFASEVELSEEEWLEGIRFLTDTGRMCDGVVRQEFILLSDVLGLSMLVDAINHRAAKAATETTVFGPFYIAGMPERGQGENMAFTPGEPALVLGRVLDTDGEPIANTVLDVWQTAENGMYSGQDTEQPLSNLRGRYRTDEEGRFAIRTIVPVSYPIPTDGPVGRLLQASDRHPWRPAHLHFMVMAEGRRTLVTHLFNHDDPYLESDVVFGVKDSLKVVYQRCQADHPLAERYDFDGPFRLAAYDFVLERA
ncbi:6-chlorohydroxyquinol-1,2-dioxygenase [Pseudomonas sp. BN417]|uniref:intradiol ring-cleavage dioxygenase n=1 Tax=Pseudomonas sp. BN417 TaxID=2567890 RepID=UPI002454C309|nr:intradiol ring-cleavage dioxygenase [Pseudomonas sp. BN417]MDH4557280.1 6-chlorohydroxyquinol-1,2-dioxygenase [Pseudomonas sp. BN417]